MVGILIFRFVPPANRTSDGQVRASRNNKLKWPKHALSRRSPGHLLRHGRLLTSPCGQVRAPASMRSSPRAQGDGRKDHDYRAITRGKSTTVPVRLKLRQRRAASCKLPEFDGSSGKVHEHNRERSTHVATCGPFARVAHEALKATSCFHVPAKRSLVLSDPVRSALLIDASSASPLSL